jgi:hypothetical protein
MNKGRVGHGASSRLTRAMGQRPITDQQRALVLRYRREVADLDQAEAALRAITDRTNKTIAELRRSGMDIGRIREILRVPGSLSTFRIRLAAGDGLLDPLGDHNPEEDTDA